MSSSDEFQIIRQVRIEGVVFGLSQEFGALVVHCSAEKRGQPLQLHGGKNYGQISFERIVNGQSECVAVFQQVEPGNYNLWGGRSESFIGKVSIAAGTVSEAGWY